MNPSYEKIWQLYVESWKVRSKDEKLALFERCLHRDSIYTDPLTQAKGWAALVDYMLDFHRQIPGGHFVTTWFLTHHQRSAAKWEMRNGENIVLGEGVSFGMYDDEHKLLSMTGFFETK